MGATDGVDVVLDLRRAGEPFGRIHEGRYEVDPEATGLSLPLPDGLGSAVQRAGVRLLRVGVGCWLPTQDPPPDRLGEREWFRGTTLADVADPAMYRWSHLDRVLDVCAALGCEVLLSVDSMPASLARPGPPAQIPDLLKPFAPPGYRFNDGVRNAPPGDSEVFAEAVLRLLDHVAGRGVTARYVELWNEPDLPFFYSGTFEEWWGMYVPFARAVHRAGLKVGGPSWAGALHPETWLFGLARRASDEDVPLDFYSFHRYDSDGRKVLQRCREVREALDSAGLSRTDAVLDEWGYDLGDAAYHGTVGNAAFTAACLMELPGAGVAAQTQVLLVDPVKDPALGRFHGLTRQDGEPNPIAHCLEMFERFQETNLRLPVSSGLPVLAGTDPARRRVQVIMANPQRLEALPVRLAAAGELLSGDVVRLTQRSFDERGGCTPPEPVQVDAGLDLVVEPESLVRLDLRAASC